MPPASPSISVIVPTLNEAENIEGIIAKILAGGASLEMEIIVVDDASKDDTQAIVRRLSETLPVTLLAREKPKDGLAGAVLAGARAAKAGVVMVIDADGSHPPEKIPELALPVIRGERDMVIGSRYAPGGSTPGWSRKRRLMSRAASACAWPLTDVHDALSGFFAVRRELLAEIPSDAAGFKIALEILVRGGDSIRVGEAPIAFRDRELGESKMGTGVILTYFRRLLALSGWRESQDTVGVAIAKTLLVWGVDFAMFVTGWLGHAGLSEANLLGFAAGGALNAWLKMDQLPAGKRWSPPFLSRLVFVSLLALFLRSGVLATCARAFGWPWPVAILPAIVAGWTVLFLGYALFIWPVREQYGRGVRWRVAGMGATAYLLALRAAYLYAMPVDQRLADLAMATQGIHTRSADGSVTGASMAAVGTGNLALWDGITLGLRNLGTAILGQTSAGFNLPAILCWCVAAWLVFKTAQRVYDKTTAFRALLLFSVLPVFFRMGAVFSPATVVATAWALALWLLTLTLSLERRPLAPVAFVFWLPAWWLPGMRAHSETPMLLSGLYFLGMQALLVTPVSLLAAWRSFTRKEEGAMRVARDGAGYCAVMAAVCVLWGFLAGRMGLTASGAIWLPLLPLIASEMQTPGCRPSRWWAPVLYGSVVCYGVYFYWLAFSQ